MAVKEVRDFIDFNKKDLLQEELQEELDVLKKYGEAPDWFTVNSWQMMRAGYIWNLGGEVSPKDRYTAAAKSAASYLPDDMKNEYEKRFFDMVWNGYLALSTPVLANMGTNRGLAVSCSGSYVPDSVHGIYDSLKECAILTKNGFGTSGAFCDVRARGDKISVGGVSSGVISWMEQFRNMTGVVSQGNTRRGTFAGYIDMESNDFDEMIDWIFATRDKVNIGFNYTDDFLEKLKNMDEEAHRRRAKLLKLRMTSGRGYIFFSDRANKLAPECYKEHNLNIKASNACTEIALHSDEMHTFSCVLSSLNGSKYDEWKDTSVVEDAIVFLDCVCEDLITRASKIDGLEKVVRFTQKSRALGLGLLGFHTYLQSKMIPFDSFQAMMLNRSMFSTIKSKAQAASEMLAEKMGQPEWAKGTKRRHTHLLAVAPNMSSAILCGGVSQGIEPIVGNYYLQRTAKGDMLRENNLLTDLLKKKGKYNKEVLISIRDENGSVQHLDFLTEEEKEVFKTAFEINQKKLLQLAEDRQEYIDQAQSINLFFAADEEEQWISEVHEKAEKSELIKSLYYVRSQAGIKADKGDECRACEG